MIEILNGSIFIDGKETVDPMLIGYAMLDKAENQSDTELTIAEIKIRLDNCIDLYTDLFCKKQECWADGWIGDLKGGINCFADAFLSFDDIRIDLEHNAVKGEVFKWYWDNVENQGKEINYHSYLKGLRVSELKDSLFK